MNNYVVILTPVSIDNTNGEIRKYFSRILVIINIREHPISSVPDDDISTQYFVCRLHLSGLLKLSSGQLHRILSRLIYAVGTEYYARTGSKRF